MMNITDSGAKFPALFRAAAAICGEARVSTIMNPFLDFIRVALLSQAPEVSTEALSVRVLSWGQGNKGRLKRMRINTDFNSGDFAMDFPLRVSCIDDRKYLLNTKRISQ